VYTGVALHGRPSANTAQQQERKKGVETTNQILIFPYFTMAFRKKNKNHQAQDAWQAGVEQLQVDGWMVCEKQGECTCFFTSNDASNNYLIYLIKPLVIVSVTFCENGDLLQLIYPLNMVIFHCYVRLPEGI
jgi:hypothetical protein